MSVYGTPLGVTLPTPDDPVGFPGPVYAEEMNGVLEAVIERLESKVTEAGLNFTQAWDLAGYAIRDLKGIDHTAVASTPVPGDEPASYSKTDGDWYLLDGGRREVRVTQAGVINVSAVGITGAGYGVSGVEVYWDGSAQRFLFLEGAGAYADVEADAIYIMDAQAEEVEYVGLLPPSSAANYTITFPAALPSQVGQLAVDNSGNLSILSQPRHDQLSLLVPLTQKAHGVNYQSETAENYVFYIGDGGTPMHVVVQCPLRAGDRVHSVTLYAQRTGNWNVGLVECDYTDTSDPRVADVVSGSGASDALVGTTGAPYTLLDTRTYQLRAWTAGGSVTDRLFGIKVVYDRP